MFYDQMSAVLYLKRHATLLAGLCFICLLALDTPPVWAQSTPGASAPQRSAAPARPQRAKPVPAARDNSENAIRQRVNAGTVTVITGGVDGISNTYRDLAGDLASVLDVKSELRVLPVTGYGSLQNIEDLLYLKGIDFGMVHSDVMRHLEQKRVLLGAKTRLKYVTKLYDEPLHVLANTKYTDMKQLNGQTVIVGRPGSGNEMSALTLIKDLGLKLKLIHVEFKEGVEQVREGKAAAMIVVTRKPSSKLRGIKPNSGLHFLPVPMTKTVLQTYHRNPLTAEDYPNLVPAGGSVETARMSAMLAVYNWRSGSPRYANVTKFIQAFAGKLDQLSQASRKDIWQKLDITDDVKAWERYEPTKEIIEKVIATRTAATPSTPPSVKTDVNFAQFVKFLGRSSNAKHTPEEFLALYQKYQAWLKASGASAQ